MSSSLPAGVSVQRTQPSPSTVVLALTVADPALATYTERAYTQLSAQVQLPGFRPGKAPAAMVRAQLPMARVLATAGDIALQELYSTVMQQVDARVVAEPAVHLAGAQPLVLELHVQVWPSVDAKNWKKHLPKTEKPAAVSAKDVDAEIERLLSQRATWEEVQRAAQDKDRAEVDFVAHYGKKHEQAGVEVPRTNAKNYLLQIGTGGFIPGFTEQILGMKAGEEKTFPITFPADYGATELAGVEVDFTITLHRLWEQKVPAATDAIAAEVTGKADATVASWKKHLQEEITKNAEAQSRRANEQKTISALLEALGPSDAPAIYVDRLVESRLSELRGQLQHAGITLDQFAQMQGTTLDEVRTQLRADATTRVREEIMLLEIVREEKIEVTNDEIEAEIHGGHDHDHGHDHGDHAGHDHGHHHHHHSEEEMAAVRQQLQLKKLFAMFA